MLTPVAPALDLDTRRAVLQVTDRLLRVDLLTDTGTPIAISPSGHVPLAAGTVYQIAITNRSARRGVAHVWLDGANVTADGLIIPAFGRVVLERCVSDTDRGRFTVRPEGDTAAFGPDGGRSNGDLGRLQVRLDLERPPARPTVRIPRASWPTPTTTPWPVYPSPTGPWLTGPIWIGGAQSDQVFGAATPQYDAAPDRAVLRSARLDATPAPASLADGLQAPPDAVAGVAEPAAVLGQLQAAGTALTGESTQQFRGVHVGPCDPDQGEVILRLVVGTPLPVPSVRPLPRVAVPVRPLAQP